ncbi:MAG: ABC transporter permease [Gemmatimonadota bacterium]
MSVDSSAPREPSTEHLQELDEELRAHLELAQDFYRARGLDNETAERVARERLGDPARIRDAVRRVYLPRWAILIRGGGRTVVAAAVIALLVANLAVLWALHGRAPRTVADGQPWLTVWSQPDGQTRPSTLSTYSVYDRLGERVDLFSAVSASRYETRAVGGPFPAERIRLKYVSVEAPRLLGWPIVEGRRFRVDEEGAPVVLLTDASWERWFDRAPSAVGSSIDVAGTTHRVVGVVGRSVDFFYPSGLVVPLDGAAERAAGARLLVTARLRDRVRLSAHPSIDLEGADGRSLLASPTLEFTPLSHTFARPFASGAWRLVAVLALLAASALSFVWPARAHPDARPSRPASRASALLFTGGVGVGLAPILAPWVGDAVAGASTSAFAIAVDAPVIATAALAVVCLVGLIETSRANLTPRVRSALGLGLQLTTAAIVLVLAEEATSGHVAWALLAAASILLLIEHAAACWTVTRLSRPLDTRPGSTVRHAPRPR